MVLAVGAGMENIREAEVVPILERVDLEETRRRVVINPL